MAKDWRTLKLEILAETKQFVTDMKNGENQVESFGDKATKMGKVAAAAFAAAAAAAAAYAGKLAIEGVKAAIEDEAAQKRLAAALQNVTDATDAQITAVEQQILKTSLATGVADDKLRPALQRLAVATGSVEESQELLNLALDISAATGKDVETVANALGKAYEGNTSSLARLGVGLSSAEIKTLGLEGSIKQLSTTFGGAAATQAETFEGKIARLKVRFDETKESVGTALLPIVEKLLTFITDQLIPGFEKFKKIAIDPVVKAIKDNQDVFDTLYKFAKDTLLPFITGQLTTGVKAIGGIVSGIVNAVAAGIRALEPIINAAITGINALIRAKNLLTSGPDTPTLAKLDFSEQGNTNLGNRPLGGVITGGTTGGNIIGGSTGAGTGSGAGVGLATGTGTGSGSGAPVITIPSVLLPSNQPIPSNFDVGGFRAAEERGNVIVNVNAPSVIDEEGFTRAVVLALNNSTNRGTTGGGDLRFNAQIL